MRSPPGTLIIRFQNDKRALYQRARLPGRSKSEESINLARVRASSALAKR